MPRALPDMTRRVITMETARRKLDIPVDAAGHIRRTRAVGDMATRAADSGDGIGFKGHAAVFNQRTWIGSKRYGWWEQIDPGAFTKTIREKVVENNDIIFNRDHNNSLLLARTSNDTLRLSEDDVGLAVDADMGDYSYARDVETGLSRRDLTGMSFAFGAITWEWSLAEDGEDLLTLREMELFDVAVCGMPAYGGTDASMRGELLACARAQGFDDPMIAALAKRLADPDDELVNVLRGLAHPLAAPAADLRESDTSQPAADAATGDDSPPAETTGEPPIRAIARAHLAMQMDLMKERVG
ncbi:MAG TPA: HK97 family phage prohead protease [Acidimicrobiales bacterium]|nr:HK97 family phage prohead protease [Acidimicrobiales bacterium]